MSGGKVADRGGGVAVVLFQAKEDIDISPDWSGCCIPGEETVPDKEQESQEGAELDCPSVVCALGIFAGPEAEVEAQLDQVSDPLGFGVGGDGRCGHDRVDNSEGCGLY